MTDANPVEKAASRKLRDLLKSSTTAALASAVKPASASPKLAPEKPKGDGMAALLAADGILPGDPLYAPLMRFETLLEQTAAGADVLNAKVQATADAEVERVRSCVDEIETQSVQRMTAVLDHSVRTLYWGMQWRTGVMLGAALCAAAMLGGAFGWWIGWREGSASVAAVEEELAAAFRGGADGAAFWLKVVKNNDAGIVEQECRGKSAWRVNGRLACRVPLWVDEASAMP
jgi:hypothetical protein